MSLQELLHYGKEKRMPAGELLRQMGLLNDRYQRFLIGIIWYGGYATDLEVLQDLRCSLEINNIWALSELSSDLDWEKELGILNLSASGLQFIDQYIWWEQDFTFLDHGKSANQDDK